MKTQKPFWRALALLLSALFLVMAAASCSNGGKTEETAAPATEAETTPEVTQAETENKPSGTPVKVILLAGQSNAVGYAYDNFKKSNPAYSEERINKINAGFDKVLIRYSNNPFIEGETNESDTFVPVTFNQACLSKYEKFKSIGPEVGLAEYLSEHFPDETFYLVKCATSGADLWNQWNISNRFDRQNLYRQMIEFVTASMQQLEDQDLAPEIVAFCWMQGESDAQGDAHTSYIGNFNALLQGIAKDLVRYMPENGMAVVDAGIKDAAVWTNYQAINNAKKEFAEKSNKRFYFDTYDLVMGNDNIHYENFGQLELGARFGDGVAQAIAVLGEAEVIS